MNHAKNTARLISLVAPETETVVGETQEDFSALRDRLQSNPHAVVLYPSPDSISLEENAGLDPVDTIVLIDGTWRKARKIWFSNPWLHEMRVCHIDASTHSNYRIRRGTQAGGLASIEAAAYALRQLKEVNTDALLNAFMAMQDNWPAQKPET